MGGGGERGAEITFNLALLIPLGLKKSKVKSNHNFDNVFLESLFLCLHFTKLQQQKEGGLSIIQSNKRLEKKGL